MSRVKLALIGCGGMGHSHLRRFHVLSERLELAAAVDLDLDVARQVAAQFPGARAEADYRRVLDGVDAALVALPHHLHHPVTRECLRAGKHVLLEKPMALTEAECQDLIALADRERRVLMVAYCMRYHPLVVGMQEHMQGGTCGDIFQVSIWTEQFTRREPGSWAHRIATLGGGQLFSHGCHYIDILLAYLGEPLRGHHMGTNFGTEWMEREGTSNICLEFEGGRLGYHFGTWGARGTRLHYAFHAHGSEGLLEADFEKRRLLRLRDDEEEVLLQLSDPGKHTENEMAHFLDCIESGERPLTDGRRSLQGLRVIWRLYEAEERGAVADLRGLGLEGV